ncbi:MAG: hypothetical protein AAGU74_09840 [Bacillota bacterium]
MKRIAILLAICMVFTLTGCRDKAPVNQKGKNGNGTIAIDLPGNTVEPASSPAADASKANNKPTSTDSPDGSISHGEAPAPPEGDIIEIKEKMFVAQTNDVYYNAPDYLGKTLKYEGIFSEYTIPETGEKYYAVIRYGPGCCGIDANAGFEVKWDKEYPKQGDWVEAVGALEEYEEDGYKYLRLALVSLTVLDTRGAEYVSQ